MGSAVIRRHGGGLPRGVQGLGQARVALGIGRQQGRGVGLNTGKLRP